MHRNRLVTLLFCFCVLAVWYGCETTSGPTPEPVKKADLVLLNNPTSGEGPYCRRTGDTLTVQVHNQGEAGTGGGQLEVRVTWIDSGVTRTTGTAVDLQPGQTQEFSFQIPAGCYGWTESCSFEIEIDPDNRISESSTSNNSAGGLCYGDHDDEDHDW